MIHPMPAGRDRPAFNGNCFTLIFLGNITNTLLTDDDLQSQSLNTTQICSLINRFSKPSSSFGMQIGIILHLEISEND